MRSLKKAVLAVSVGLLTSGCVHTQSVDRAGPAADAPAPEAKVIRALPSYGSMGGYRYRRFAIAGA